MTTTRVTRQIGASRARVYAALLNAEAIRRWKVPDGMSAEVHELDAREGGRFRVSLTYDAPSGSGKTTPTTDTYHGRFVELVPDQRVVDVLEFETDDPAMAGEMTSTITLAEAEGGTLLTAVHENLPPGLSPADNETGWSMALERLARMLERDE